MPVTPFQREVIEVLRGQRSSGSHFAGSLPLHIASDSDRYSHDFDIFHDAKHLLAEACAADLAALAAAGFTVIPGRAWSDTFRRATAQRGADAVDVDWAVDAAWRFFPVLPDGELGWRLHPFDLACNKALALSARSETRDLVDIVEWSRRYSLPAILWAACGKDPGFNPLMLLTLMRRFATVRPDQLKEIAARRIEPTALKMAWLDLAEDAHQRITALADAQTELAIGVAFLDADREPCWPADLHRPLAEQGLTLHAPTVSGCWPMVYPSGEAPAPR